MHRSQQILLLCLVMIVLAACDALPADSSIVVKPDEIAVVYDQSTGAYGKTLTEGVHEINLLEQGVTFYPLFWQVYTFREQLSDDALGREAIRVWAKDNAPIRISLSVVFRLNPDEINKVFDSWNRDDYRTSYVVPTTQGVVIGLISAYTWEEISEMSTEELQEQIETALRTEFEANGFLLQRVDLAWITLNVD